MKRIVSLILSCSLLISALIFCQSSAFAATFDDINQPEVFIKQQPKTCTLASAVMMVRRATILCDKTNWKKITEDSMRSTAWIEGTGLRWEFTYKGITYKGLFNFCSSLIQSSQKLSIWKILSLFIPWLNFDLINCIFIFY